MRAYPNKYKAECQMGGADRIIMDYILNILSSVIFRFKALRVPLKYKVARSIISVIMR